MYLKFFIKSEDKVLEEVAILLKESGFSVKTQGRCEDYRIVFFNGSEAGNFYYTGHKLFQDPPEGTNSPFLVRVGRGWTVQGLLDLLRNYSCFRLPCFDPLDFPQKEDFNKRGSTDKMLVEKLDGMERTAMNCNANGREVEIIKEIKANLRNESAGDIKQRRFYFLLNEKKVILPWGGPPKGKESKERLIAWLEKANDVFLEHKNINGQYAESFHRIRKIKDTLQSSS